MSHDRVVYTGDLSAEDYSAVTQVRNRRDMLSLSLLRVNIEL